MEQRQSTGNWQRCLSSKRKADAILVYTFLYAFYWIYFTFYVIQDQLGQALAQTIFNAFL